MLAITIENRDWFNCSLAIKHHGLWRYGVQCVFISFV